MLRRGRMQLSLVPKLWRCAIAAPEVGARQQAPIALSSCQGSSATQCCSNVDSSEILHTPRFSSPQPHSQRASPQPLASSAPRHPLQAQAAQSPAGLDHYIPITQPSPRAPDIPSPPPAQDVATRLIRCPGECFSPHRLDSHARNRMEHFHEQKC
ncbi:hypothetical protein HDV57DRAFT_318917 [Trichoderma longibrachiatum]